MKMVKSSGGVWMALPLLILSSLLSIQTEAQVSALGLCSDITASETYRISVDGLTIGDRYDVYIDTNGTPFLDTTILVAAGTSYQSPTLIDYEDGTQTVDVRVIHDPVLPGPNDTTDFVVHEVLCIDADFDGVMDFDTAVCDFTMPMPTNGAIVSTVAPYNGDNVYLYVLTDTAGVLLDNTLNYKGHFTGLENGGYKVYAYNFLNTADASSFMAQWTVGSTDMDTVNTSTPACYNYCGSASYTVDCSCIINIDSDPMDLTVCPEDDGEFVVSTSISSPIPPGAVLEYLWQKDDGGWTNLADTDSILNLFSIPFADSGKMFRVIVTLDVGGTDICRDTSAVATLNVYQDPVLANTLDNLVCSDEAAGIVLDVAPTSVDADSFDVVSITPGPGLVGDAGNAPLGRTANPNIIAGDIWTNQSSQYDTVIYAIAPISATDCVGDTTNVYLVIKPEPLFTGNLDNTVCSDEQVSVGLPTLDDGGLAIDSYYVNVAVPGTLSANLSSTGSTTDPDFIAADSYHNVTGSVDTVVYTIAPFSDGCLGDSIRIKVAVKPEPLFTGNLDNTVCSDTDIEVNLPFQDDSALAIDSFTISAPYVGSGLTAVTGPTIGSGITTFDTIASDVYTNIGTALDSVIYKVLPYSAGCEGDTITIVVTVTPEPVGSDPEPVVCSDSPLAINLHSLITNGSSVDTFFWSAADNPNVTGETLSTSTDSIIGDILNNVSNTDQIVTYTITPKSGECVGDPFIITVTVSPEPVVADEIFTACSDMPLGIILPDSSDNMQVIDSFDISATVGTNLTGTPTEGNGVTDRNALVSDIFTNLSSAEDTVFYTITPYSGACVGDPYQIAMVIKPEPILDSPALDTTICSNSPIGVILAVKAGSVAADSFNIVSIDSAGVKLIGGTPTTGMTGDISEIADDIWENTGATPVTVTYWVSPVSEDGCIGDTASIVVTIDPEVLVEAGSPLSPVCSNGSLDLSTLGASITGGATDGTWTTLGDGSFGPNGTFSTALTYTPGIADIAAGTVTLRLTSNDPTGACGEVFDEVVITINDVECSQFPWNGKD